MRALLYSAVLAVSALSVPASAAPQPGMTSFDGPLPPGCFEIWPGGPVFCNDMPLG